MQRCCRLVRSFSANAKNPEESRAARYKLYYFPYRCRAETIRQLLLLGGQPYEEVTINIDQWKADKELRMKMPFARLPVLQVDDVMIGQSVSIQIYLAHKFGYAGIPSDEPHVNAAAYQLDEFHCDVTKYRKAVIGETKATHEEKAKLFEKVLVPFRERHLRLFCNTLKENNTGSGYLVGASLTHADLAVADTFHGFEKNHPGFLKQFPEIVDLISLVHSNPVIKERIATRPAHYDII